VRKPHADAVHILELPEMKLLLHSVMHIQQKLFWYGAETALWSRRFKTMTCLWPWTVTRNLWVLLAVSSQLQGKVIFVSLRSFVWQGAGVGGRMRNTLILN